MSTTTDTITDAEERSGTITQMYRVYIRTTPEKVWEAITTPEWTQKFGYGGTVDVELRPGGHFIHSTSPEMRSMGAPDVAVDGEIIESDPPRRLVQTWRMAMDEAMKAEGFTKLTYDIERSSDDVTRLTITHDLTGAPNLALIVGGERESQGAGGGWAWVLSDLKSLLETGARLSETWPSA